MTKKIVILGTNGNCVDIYETIEDINARQGRRVYECLGFLDDNPELHGKALCGMEILGPLTKAGELDDCWAVNGIGSPTNHLRKEDIIARTNLPLERFETIIHPSATVSRSAEFGRGTVVFDQVSVNSNARIGNHVVILPLSVISHDVVIGDYTCITGGVCISGGAHIGRHCYLGSNSSIIGGVTIGDSSLIGMGSVVLDDVADGCVVVGAPARFLRFSR